MLGTMAGRSLNDLVYKTIMAGIGTHWTSGRKNTLTTSSALSAASLGQAIGLLRKQTDPNGASIQITPAVLLVPPELEMTAKSLVSSTLVGTSDGTPTGNPLQGIVEVVVESRLSNPNYTGNSATGWWLMGRPIDIPVIVGFLEGRQAPTVESFGLNQEVDNLGFSWRVYHDFGAALGDYRASVYATGAAAN
jgi:hypothetical protein